MELTQSRLKQLLHYSPDTGLFTWKVPRRGSSIGSVAGRDCKGYVYISIDNQSYGAHRLAWLYTYGKWPGNNIDHDDGNRANNRIKNLFDRTQAQNLQGFQQPRANNSSGYRGVHWDERLQAWTACYMRNGVSHFCGVHDTPEKAAQALADHKAGKPVTARGPRNGKNRVALNQ